MNVDEQPGVQLEAVLPVQFMANVGQRTPEQRLLFAVLVDALFNYHRSAEARCWVDTADASYLFSFTSICDAFGLAANEIRRHLKAHPVRLRRQRLERDKRILVRGKRWRAA